MNNDRMRLARGHGQRKAQVGVESVAVLAAGAADERRAELRFEKFLYEAAVAATVIGERLGGHHFVRATLCSLNARLKSQTDQF